MDEVNLLLPMASPSPPRVLQFALFHPFWAHSMALACPMSSGPVVLVQLNPGFWQHLLSRSPSRDGITSALLLLKHLFCCLPIFLALNTSPAAEQSGAG